MKARAVVRDVARVMDIPYADADRVAKAIPPALDMTLAKALEENPALKEMEQKDERIKELLAVARRLEGMTRHASVHAAGVVIAPRPLTEFVPLYKSQKDEIVTQWAMKEVERVGLLKMDFLGLSTLTLIRDALEEIKRTEGIDLDIDAIPLDDAKTYKLFGDGQTYGVFQFESSGMRELLRKAKPERLDDLIALNALYRPGPLKSGMVDDYIARKQGKTEVKYELAPLAPILGSTYGVIAYQEQVMRIAAVLAGFTMGQSDMLRKAMGKKDPKVMAKQREAFMDGAEAKGISEKKATKIFDLMEFFAGYGFNKSHSTTYALRGLSDRLPEGELSRALHGRAADDRSGEHRQARDVSRRVPRPRRPDPRARHQLERARVHGRQRRRAVRACAPSRTSAKAPSSRCSPCARSSGGSTRSTRCASTPTCASSTSASSRAWSRRGRWTRCWRRRRGAWRRAGRASSPPSTRRSSTAAAISATATRGSRSCSAAAATSPRPRTPPCRTRRPWTEAQQLAGEKEALGLYMSGHPLERFADELKVFGARRVAELTASEADVWVGGHRVAACAR